MTVVIESDYVMYLSALNTRPDWFFLVLITFWQMIHCSLQTKTSRKAVLWQGNRTHNAVVNAIRISIFTAVPPAIAWLAC